MSAFYKFLFFVFCFVMIRTVSTGEVLVYNYFRRRIPFKLIDRKWSFWSFRIHFVFVRENNILPWYWFSGIYINYYYLQKFTPYEELERLQCIPKQCKIVITKISVPYKTVVRDINGYETSIGKSLKIIFTWDYDVNT